MPTRNNVYSSSVYPTVRVYETSPCSVASFAHRVLRRQTLSCLHTSPYMSKRLTFNPDTASWLIRNFTCSGRNNHEHKLQTTLQNKSRALIGCQALYLHRMDDCHLHLCLRWLAGWRPEQEIPSECWSDNHKCDNKLCSSTYSMCDVYRDGFFNCLWFINSHRM